MALVRLHRSLLVSSKRFYKSSKYIPYKCKTTHNSSSNVIVNTQAQKALFSSQTQGKSSPNPRLIWLVYLSGLFGGIMGVAIIRREYKKYQQRKKGIVELNIPAFGNRISICKYKGVVLFDVVSKCVEDVETFDVREDDVWVISYPRSGTTWTQEIVYLTQTGLNFHEARSQTLDDRFPYLEFVYPGINEVAKYPSPRLIKSHLPLHLLPADLHKKKPKIIYIARNPKDVVVSYFHFIRMLSPFRFSGKFPEFFNLFMNDQLPYSPWGRHVKDFWEQRNESHILFLMYEDLKKDLPGVISQIAVFLGKSLTQEQVSQIAEHCSFQKMKSNSTVNHTWFDQLGLRKEGEADFIRKGQVGDWKNYLTREMSGRVDKLLTQTIGDAHLPFEFDTSDQI